MTEGSRPRVAWWQDAVALAVLAGCFAVYVVLFRDVLPGGRPNMAVDYHLHLTNLLAGYFFYLQNGLTAVPWFTPAVCGGVPYLPDLNTAYYALPQWLTIVVGPKTAIITTVYAFLPVGGLGFYILLRSRFGLSPAVAVAAAVFFMFNGMYLSRMVGGHLTFHPFMLAPWVAWATLMPLAPDARWNRTRAVSAVVVIGGAFAYAFQAGMVHLILPMALAVVVVILVHGIVFRLRPVPWTLFGGGIVVALLLSAQRVSAVLALTAQIPRDYYDLTGIPDVFKLVSVIVQSVFWYVPGATARGAIVNAPVYMGDGEWAYGVGPAVAAVLMAGAGWCIWRIATGDRPKPTRGAGLALVAIAVIGLVPIALNVYSPGWNVFLKTLPLIGSSTVLSRWFAMYIVIAPLVAALVVAGMVRLGGAQWIAAVVLVGATLGWNAMLPREVGSEPGVDHYTIVPDVLEASWQVTKTGQDVPPVSEIRVSDGIVVETGSFAFGYSDYPCYLPIFGYQLEKLPVGSLYTGSSFGVNLSGTLNIKNPACYVFPEENGCRPGAHFSEAQADEALAFVSYQTFAFERSTRQMIADAVNLVALALVPLAFVLAFAVDSATRRRSLAT